MHSRVSGTRWLLLALWIAAPPSACTAYNSPPPAPKPTPQPPAPAASVVQLPVALAVADLQPLIETGLPTSEDLPRFNGSVNGGADNCHGGGLNYGYHIDRAPVQVGATADNGLTVGADIRYAGGVRFRKAIDVGPIHTCSPLVTASCGYDGDPMKGAHVGMVARPAVSPDWSVLLNAGNASANPTAGTCNVTIFGFDVTGRVMGFARDFLNRQAAAINQRVASDRRLRTRVESGWRAAFAVVPVGAGWLAIAPEEAGIAPVTVRSDSLRTVVRAVARTVFHAGQKPEVTPTPLPQNTVPSGPDALRIDLPVEADYGAIAAAIRKEFRIGEGGIRYPATGRFFLRPTAVDVLSNGPDLVVRVAFSGSAKGVFYLAGTPVYDPATRVVSVPNLDYTAETKNLLLRLADWVGHDALRNDLRAKARIDLTAPLQRARQTVTASLNQTVGPLTLTGRIDDLDMLGIQVQEQQRQVSALIRMTGQLSGTLHPAP